MVEEQKRKEEHDHHEREHHEREHHEREHHEREHHERERERLHKEKESMERPAPEITPRQILTHKGPTPIGGPHLDSNRQPVRMHAPVEHVNPPFAPRNCKCCLLAEAFLDGEMCWGFLIEFVFR